MFEEKTASVYATIDKWTLEVWEDDCLEAMKGEGLPNPQIPGYLDGIRRYRRPEGSPSKAEVPIVSGLPSADSINYSNNQFPGQDGDLPGFDNLASYDFSDLLSFETNPNEWERWDVFSCCSNHT